MSTIDYCNEFEMLENASDTETEVDQEIIDSFDVSDSETEDFQDCREGVPDQMDEPAFMKDIELKSRSEIVAILRGSTKTDKERLEQRLELVMYMYMNTEHRRVSNDDLYGGANEIHYNDMTLYGADELIGQMFNNKVSVFKQAPERSGKTLQMMLDVLMGYHTGCRGVIGIGSPKDNVDSVHADLNDAQDKFKSSVLRSYPKTNAAFLEVFKINIYGPKFKFYDGGMTREEFTELKTYLKSGSIVPVFSATALPPLKSMFQVLTHLRDMKFKHMVLFDEADAVVKPLTTTSDKMKAIIENILGMRGNIVKTCDCGHTHICGTHTVPNAPIGKFGSAEKIMLLSATMNLAVEFFNTRENIETIDVMRPYANRAIRLRGGVNINTRNIVQMDEDDEDEVMTDMINDYFSMRTTQFATQNITSTGGTTTRKLRHQYILDNSVVNETSDESKYNLNKIMMLN
jgi:hypothetical protein